MSYLCNRCTRRGASTTGGLLLLTVATCVASGVAQANATPRLSPQLNHQSSQAMPMKVVADLPKPDFQWKSVPFISLGAGYGEVGGKNITGKTSTNAVGIIALGLEFAQYKRASFNASLGLMTGSDVSIYTQSSYASGDPPQDVEIQEGINLMLGTKVDLIRNWYASVGIGALLQRINMQPIRTSLQMSYQAGLGYRLNQKASAELSYFGTVGRSVSVMNTDEPTSSHGGARYGLGLLSLNYKL